ncbi:MAG: SprT-like domain-containing protein [Candidatus Acidiferrum sp.]|jgi:predicted SprT family Zn-dependent metalloprotease
MRRLIHITVSLVCLAAILFGARYAWGRERLRQADLSGLYQQINEQSFDGSLPDVAVEWSELPDDYGKTTFYDDGRVEIGIDRESVTDDEQLTETMQHEMCHVATRDEVVKTGQDAHGAAFQACMNRFE